MKRSGQYGIFVMNFKFRSVYLPNILATTPIKTAARLTTKEAAPQAASFNLLYSSPEHPPGLTVRHCLVEEPPSLRVIISHNLPSASSSCAFGEALKQSAAASWHFTERSLSAASNFFSSSFALTEAERRTMQTRRQIILAEDDIFMAAVFGCVFGFIYLGFDEKWCYRRWLAAEEKKKY